ncbi:MAG: hypothetical protein JW827_03630 [Spirochaetes bacterium]|nr:hypothetical protein [Spirochaetota bacterium]
MSVEIKKVTGTKEMKKFIKLPWDIFKNDPLWAPPLLMEEVKRVNKKKNPFFEYGDADFFLAYRDGKPVGRIAAIDNPKHNEFHKDDRTGFWGFFDCINDQNVADALFNAAKEWVKTKGHKNMRGPMSCDTNDEVGMVIDGFENLRYFMMPHNPPYYFDLCKKYKMTRAKDLFCFHLDLTKPVPERILSIAEKIQERYEKQGYVFRSLNKKNLKHDLRIIMDIYQEAWKENWGFSPMTKRQFDEMAESMSLIAVEDMIIIIESPEGKPVGMAVALYNWMECTHYARKFPKAFQGIMQLLNLAWRLFLKPKPKFRSGRLFLAGVMPEFRNRGFDAILYVFPFMAGKKLKLKEGELSWELEDNTAIISPIEKVGGKVYRKLRIWDCRI